MHNRRSGARFNRGYAAPEHDGNALLINFGRRLNDDDVKTSRFHRLFSSLEQ
jgi:hypothetical protein